MSDLSATNCNSGCGCNNIGSGNDCSIIIIILLLCCCGGNGGLGGIFGGNGCNDGCGSIILIILILCLCGGNGFGGCC